MTDKSKGWLHRHIQETQERIAQYPAWMRRAMRFEGGLAPKTKTREKK